MKFVFNIKSGEKFPEASRPSHIVLCFRLISHIVSQVDSFGGIDSFIEIRATRSDVKLNCSGSCRAPKLELCSL